MHRSICVVIAALAIGVSVTSLHAQGLVEATLVGQGPLDPIMYAVKDGGGVQTMTASDPDALGRIKVQFPTIDEFAVGIRENSDDDGDVDVPDCIIWDIDGAGPPYASLPYEFPVFADVSGGTLGIDFGPLKEPPTVLFQWGQQFEVVDGRIGVWSDIRLIDDSGVNGLEDFVNRHDILPDFNGTIVVTNLSVHFAPEPGTIVMLVPMAAIILKRRSRRQTL